MKKYIKLNICGECALWDTHIQIKQTQIDNTSKSNGTIVSVSGQKVQFLVFLVFFFW